MSTVNGAVYDELLPDLHPPSETGPSFESLKQYIITRPIHRELTY